jgi:cytochrome c oxidase subunit 4
VRLHPVTSSSIFAQTAANTSIRSLRLIHASSQDTNPISTLLDLAVTMNRTTPLLRQIAAASRTITRNQTSLQQVRCAHAISNPTLANIEKRWEDMPPQEQADLWMALRDRMKVNWNELTVQEKKAGT